MLLSKFKRIFIALILMGCVFTVFAASNDLSSKFLNRANEAFEENNINDAYKFVNQALAVSREDAQIANAIYLAQVVYTAKLQNLSTKYDEVEFFDIQMNLEKYPNLANSKIKKLVKQIEVSQENKRTNAEKQAQREQFEKQQAALNDLTTAFTNSSESQAKAIEDGLKNFSETSAKNNEELKNALQKSAEETKNSTKIIAISVIGIAMLVLLVVLLIIYIVKKNSKQQQIQQEQYIQAFRVLANNQQTTNRLMIGGMTNLYGGNSGLKLAGSSSWSAAAALPDVEFTPEDQQELQDLASKCEELGAKIDQVSGRKNNSKNVSELVYKLSVQLGLPQELAMLNFCAAMVYDAGFLGIDPELLSATSLTDEQKEAMKEHVNLAEKYLIFVPKKYWSVFEDAATKHHENMDGTGYPQKLKGEKIPQIARLIRVAETYVSLSSRRAYRQTMDKETAIQTLKEQPNLYDIEVVNTLDQIV